MPWTIVSQPGLGDGKNKKIMLMALKVKFDAFEMVSSEMVCARGAAFEKKSPRRFPG